MDEVEQTELRQLDQEISACRLCLDAGHAIVPGPIFSHPPGAKVMLIGQAPGVTEVEAGRPFNAGSGRRLFQWLAGADWQEDDFRARNVMTAVTKCYPGKANNGKGDRVPGRDEQKLCSPFLERELRLIKPLLIMLVGGLAIKLVYPAKLRLVDVIGTAVFFPSNGADDILNLSFKKAQLVTDPNEIRKQNGRWVVPLPHPSGASLWPNKPYNKALIERGVEILARLRKTYQL